MSYILDALRRAEAERQRGQLPGLNAQAVPATALPDARRGAAAWGWPMLVGGIGLAALAAVAVLWSTRVLPPQPVALLPAAAPASVPAPLPVPAAAPAAPATAAALPVLVSAPPAVVPARAASAGQAGPAAPAAPRPVPLAELTPEQRRELPALAIGGSIWSDSAANRFVIVNDQLAREGEALAAGVTLEHIGPKALVLRWRGLRIEMPL